VSLRNASVTFRSRQPTLRATALLELSSRIRRGTPPKTANARAWPSRNASGHARGKAETKTASESGQVMTNSATVVVSPSRVTSAWPKSTWASPGR